MGDAVRTGSGADAAGLDNRDEIVELIEPHCWSPLVTAVHCYSSYHGAGHVLHSRNTSAAGGDHDSIHDFEHSSDDDDCARGPRGTVEHAHRADLSVEVGPF